MIQVYFSERAARDAEEIDGWWRRNRPSAPSLFVGELRYVVSVLEAAPQLGVAYEPYASKGIRRILLPRTKHHVYFRRRNDDIEIVTIWGTTRGRDPAI